MIFTNFTKFIAIAITILAFIPSVLSDVVYFENYTGEGRWLHFTPNKTPPFNGLGNMWLPPSPNLADPKASGKAAVFFDGLGPESNRGQGWCGNFKAKRGWMSDDVRIVLGEVCFRSDAFGNTYYDVSVVDDPNSNEGIHWMFPLNDHNGVISGCNRFPCAGSYTRPGDIQTQSTWDRDFVVEIRD